MMGPTRSSGLAIPYPGLALDAFLEGVSMFKIGLALLVWVWSGLVFAADGAPVASILLAGEDDWPPYSAADKRKTTPDHEPLGFSAKLIRAAFATQGIAVRFTTVPFARCMRLAKSEKVAGCFNATITSENRNDYLWHQPPMFREELSIFGPPQTAGAALRLEDLRGKSVAVTNGYTYPSAFMQDTRIQKYWASSDDNLIQMLLNKRVDYILLNRTPGWLRIDATPGARGQVAWRGTVSADDFWIAFSRQYPQSQRLAEAFGKGLTQLHENGRYQRMLEEFRKQVGFR